MQLIFTDLYKKPDKEQFINKLLNISTALGINPNWLLAVMKSESNLDPQAVNRQPAHVPGYDQDGIKVKPEGMPDSDNKYTRSRYRATGLIQFMPTTAKALGTSTTDLYLMTGTEQLDYVYKYYLPYKNKLKSYYDLYLVTFFPAAVGKPDDWVFQTSKIAASKVAQANPGIDANKDGKITIAEFKGYLQRTIPDSIKQFVFDLADAVTQIVNKKKTEFSVILLLGLTAFVIFDK
jgi:hypothetical protein